MLLVRWQIPISLGAVNSDFKGIPSLSGFNGNFVILLEAHVLVFLLHGRFLPDFC